MGLLFALFGLWTALTPSLVPRTWWMLAVSVSLSTLLFYGIGSLIGTMARWFADAIVLRISASPRAVRHLTWVGAGLIILISVWMWLWSVKQQTRVANTVGLRRDVWFVQTVGVPAGILLFTALLLLIRLIVRGVRKLYYGVHKVVAQPVVATIVVVLVVSLLLWASNSVVVRVTANTVAHQTAELNKTTAPGRIQPSSPLRSGSPDSMESWDTLGRQGQDVITNGPSAVDINAVTGKPALTPIRVYAGFSSKRTFEQEANGVLAELLRTKAFDRKVLVVQFGTGSGWLEEWSVAAVEYLTNGDCATASMQYSYLGSVGAFLLDRDSPKEGSRVLFDVIHDYWSSLDPHHRPKLYVSGVSLGAYGGQSAFASAQDMAKKVDGAVWAGTPGFTPLWNSLTQSRRAGSPEIAPVIDNGETFRFATTPDELHHDHWGVDFPRWEGSHIAFLQHASDPIVWWQPQLITREPDWIREKAGEDVNPYLSWTPWSTFWQVTADMAASVSTPGGHGHNYHDEFVPVWRDVLGITGNPPIDRIAAAIPHTMRER